MSGLMGDWTCKPVREQGIYAVYQRGDIDALKERCARLQRRVRELCRENTALARELDRLCNGPYDAYDEKDMTYLTD